MTRYAPLAAVSAVEVDGLFHRYGERVALAGVSLTVRPGEIFGLLGPNGGGKTTLFRILATLLRPSGGRASVFAHDVCREPEAVRRHLGVVFQHPGLDGKLTVAENLRHHGHLFGLHGPELSGRIRRFVERLRLLERLDDRVEGLSGGLRRRVELAKALIPEPDLLLLDEPSTGLDPGSRREFTALLGELRARDGLTAVLTTHILDEAEACDRLGVLHAGRLVAVGTPDELKARVGGDVVVIRAARPQILLDKLQERFGCAAALVGDSLRLERPRGHEFVRDVVEAFPAEVQAVSVGRPTLEDVFIRLTGRRLEAGGPGEEDL